MNEEKQIEEKHELSESIYMSGHGLDWKDSNDIAEQLHNEGYRKQSEWIPVSEPPKENGIYCVMVENHKSSKYKQRTHARYKNGRWLDLYDNWENRCWHVTHWMPLPEPPKGV